MVSLGLFTAGLQRSSDTASFEQQSLLVGIQQIELSTLDAETIGSPEAVLSMLRLDVGNRLLLNGGLPGPLMAELNAELSPLPASSRFVPLAHSLGELQQQLIVLQRASSVEEQVFDSFLAQMNSLYEEIDSEIRHEEQLAIQRAQQQRIQLLIISVLLLLGVIGLLFVRLTSVHKTDTPISEMISTTTIAEVPKTIDLRSPANIPANKSSSIRNVPKAHHAELLRPLVALSDYRIHGLILPARASDPAFRRIEIAEEIWKNLDNRGLSIPIIVGFDQAATEGGLELPPHSQTAKTIELGIAAPSSAAILEETLSRTNSDGWRTRITGMTLPLSESIDFRRWPIAAAHIDPELLQPTGPSEDIAAIGRSFSEIGVPVVADELNDSSMISPLVRSGVAYGSGQALAQPVYMSEVVDWAQDILERPSSDRR